MVMMISKFHKLIQSKVVWGAFAILISVAFVVVYTPASKSRSQQKRRQKADQLAGRLFGEEVTRQELGQAWSGIRVMVTMQSMLDQRFGMSDEQMYQAAWQRLAMLKKASQLGMVATDEQITTSIQRHPFFQNRQTGQYDPDRYNLFVAQILPQHGMGQSGFEQVFRENVLIRKVSAIPAQGALVTEGEIKEAFHFYTDKFTVEYAPLPHRIADTPDLSVDEVENYFESNKEQFRIPEAVRVDYVQFAVSNYLDQVEVTDETIAQIYEQNKQRFLKEPAEDAAADTPPEFKPLEEVRDEIVAETKQMRAIKLAFGDAEEMASELSQTDMTFEKAAEKAGLAIKKTAQFNRTDRVKGIDPTAAKFAQTAFSREKTKDDYYSDPIVGRDFVYVLALTDKYDSFLPELDVVREDVGEVAKIAAAEKAYVEKVVQVQEEIQTALKAGTSFSDAVAQHELELKTTQPFDISTPLDDEFGNEIKAAIAWFDQGTLTGPIPTRDTFIVAYLAERVPGDETTDLPAMHARLSAQIARDKADRLVAAWSESLLEEAGFEDLSQRNDES